MDRKSTGIDFDRDAFVPPPAHTPVPETRWPGLLLLLVAVGVLGLIGYKFLIQNADESGSDSRSLAQIDQRMADIEQRLEKIEQDHDRPVPDPVPASRKAQVPNTGDADVRASARPTYRIYPSPPPAQAAHPDPAAEAAISQRVAGLQQNLGDLQQNTVADREAWQATTDRLADVSGQVGTQQMQLMRSEDELNQLLARTQRTAIPFELHRGRDREPVGPISLSLKSTNPKTQRYTLCAYVQDSCLELKERNRYEVVQFVNARYSTPLEVIATSILKDGITGYLEVPNEKGGH